MTIFINFVLSFFTSVIAWLVRKIGVKAALLTIQKTVQILMFASFLAAFLYFVSIVNTVYEFVSGFVLQWQTFGTNISATAYGNDFVSLFWGVMDSSGIGLAVVTIINMYLVVIFLLLGKYLYRVFINITKIIYQYIDDTLKLIAA